MVLKTGRYSFGPSYCVSLFLGATLKKGTKMIAFIVTICIWSLSLWSMENRTPASPTLFDISYKKMVKILGYPAFSYLARSWLKERTAQTDATNTDRPEPTPPQSPETSPRLATLLTGIHHSIPNDQQKMVCDDVLADDIRNLCIYSYIPELRKSPCVIVVFADEFDSKGTPIIITRILSRLVFFDIAKNAWIELPKDRPIADVTSVVHHKKHFLYGDWNGNVFLETGKAKIRIPRCLGPTINALALTDTMLAWGNSFGRVRVHTISNTQISRNFVIDEREKPMSPITALALQSNKLFSGAADSTVKIWDCRNAQIAQRIKIDAKNEYHATSLLPVEPSYIRVGCSNGALITYDCRMLSKPVHRANGSIYGSTRKGTEALITLAQKDDATLYSATPINYALWGPGFEYKTVLNNLTFNERMWLHGAMQPELLPQQHQIPKPVGVESPEQARTDL
jgi:hypothetical protein